LFSVPKEIKILIIKIVSNAKNAPTKKIKLNNLEQIDDYEKSREFL